MNEWRECGRFTFYRPGYRGRKFRYKQYAEAFRMSWSIAKGGRKWRFTKGGSYEP